MTASTISRAQPAVNMAGRVCTSLSVPGWRFDRLMRAMPELCTCLKTFQVCAALVPHPCLGEQTATVAALEYAGGEVNVLAKTHLAKAVERIVYLAAHAHVE